MLKVVLFTGTFAEEREEEEEEEGERETVR